MSVIKYILFTLFTFVTLAQGAPAVAGDWRNHDAGYEVPVPKELERFASFTMTDMRSRIRGGVHEIRYTLPIELTGRSIEVHSRSLDGGRTFQGPHQSMDCRESAVDCKVSYPGLKLDAAEVQSRLEAMGIQGEELGARLKVHEFFAGGDIAGIIHFKSK